MDREYDIFEKFLDGGVEWRDCVVGVDATRAKLTLLASRSNNECFALHTATNEIVARVNAPAGPLMD